MKVSAQEYQHFVARRKAQEDMDVAVLRFQRANHALRAHSGKLPALEAELQEAREQIDLREAD